MKSSSSSVTLVTFPVSHFCEKARFALDYFGVPYVEDAHTPLAHKSRTQGNSVPTLVLEDGTLVIGSDVIMSWALKRATRHSEQMAEPEGVAELNAWLDEFGVRTRQWAYFYILQDRPLTLDQLAPEGHVPSQERSWLSWSLWALTPLMRWGMKISEVTVQEALAFISKSFDRVEDMLKKSEFLSGDAFGCLDINFVALAAPVILPPEFLLYNSLYQRLADGSPMKEVVHTLRARPAGQFVLKCYKTFRKM